MIRWAAALCVLAGQAAAELPLEERLIHDIVFEGCLPYFEDGISPFDRPGSPFSLAPPEALSSDELWDEANILAGTVPTFLVLDGRGTLSVGPLGQADFCALWLRLEPAPSGLRIDPAGFLERMTEALAPLGFIHVSGGWDPASSTMTPLLWAGPSTLPVRLSLISAPRIEGGRGLTTIILSRPR